MALTNAQYDALMRSYDLRRQEEVRAQKARTEETYARIPEIAELDRKIASLGIEAAKRRILAGTPSGSVSGPSDDTAAAIDTLSREKRKLLVRNGYPEDYLEMRYRCPICHDTGFTEDGKCACFLAEEAAILTDRSSLRAAIPDAGFDRFDLAWYPEDLFDKNTGMSARSLAETAKAAAEKTARNIGFPGNNLFLFGECGVGKTFLSWCIAKEALEKGRSVLYYSSQDLMDLFGDAMIRKDTEAIAAADLARACDLLIIDDLGTEMTNTFVNAQLFRCVNDRILRDRTTVISTNLTLEALRDTYSERVYSRIMSHYTIIKLIGKDIRLSKKLAGGSL